MATWVLNYVTLIPADGQGQQKLVARSVGLNIFDMFDRNK
jgi:hypothetical protein